MSTETPPSPAASVANASPEKRPLSIFELPESFFDACHLVHPSATSIPDDDSFENHASKTLDKVSDEDGSEGQKSSKNAASLDRWTCNTCKAEFESLQDQRSHFKLDVHRFNVKLSMAGKDTVNEEDFDELTSDSFKDFDVSSISGSEDEDEKGSFTTHRGAGESFKQKLYVRLQKGEKVSLWRSLLLDDSQSISYESDKTFSTDDNGFVPCVRESQVIEKLKSFIHEPRDGTHLRIVLLASGGHFAGCVFDGNVVVAHKTFHRYVVRAKAGKKQSSKDGAGRTVHSAGASLRRYNELALKKDIQELLGAWKTYFDASLCVFIYAPSSNRQLLFNGEKSYFSNQHCVVRKVPSVVRRPTLKEARRIYNQLTQVSYEVDEKEKTPGIRKVSMLGCNMSNDNPSSAKENLEDKLAGKGSTTACSSDKKADEPVNVSKSESEVILATTPLHEAAHIGDVDKLLELLEQGLDPCIKDERGRTPYMLASEKEVRNTFRRYMAENLDKWDWHEAKVPSPLTKEMEESQSAKQAEKDAKKKARAKELKKLRKAKEKEKKAEAEATSSQNASGPGNLKGLSQPSRGSSISKEEEAKRSLAAEREKRAAAAERRLASAQVNNASSSSTTASTQPRSSMSATDIICSCCNSSLEGKVPFHRYNYKYCSTSCMHVHRQILEDA